MLKSVFFNISTLKNGTQAVAARAPHYENKLIFLLDVGLFEAEAFLLVDGF